MADPVTIDNLGPEFHNRYAADQDFLNISLISQARGIAAQVVKDSQSPLYSDELGDLLGLRKRPQSWSLFSKPPGFAQQNLYKHENLIPSLGSDAKQQHQMDTIKEALQGIKDKKKKKRKRNTSVIDEETDEEETGNHVIALLDFLDRANQSHREIIGRIREFTPG